MRVYERKIGYIAETVRDMAKVNLGSGTRPFRQNENHRP